MSSSDINTTANHISKTWESMNPDLTKPVHLAIGPVSAESSGVACRLLGQSNSIQK